MISCDYKYVGEMALEGGGTISNLNIRYHVSSSKHEGKRIIWICHALTANSDPSEWWDTLCGQGKYFDTDRDYIICANILCSCYGTNFLFSSGKDIETVSIRDMVAAHELLREHLSIDHIDLLIGASSGGFQAVEWAVSNPTLHRNVCLLATNAMISPWGTAFNEAQRMALRADNIGPKGLAAARAMALISYRSYEGYLATQYEKDQNFFLATRAVTYQQHQGDKLVKRFSPLSYYLLTLGLDTHNIGRGRDGVVPALGRITANLLCIAIDSDVLFPLQEMQFIINAKQELGGEHRAQLEIIKSIYGHDGFLLEFRQISKALDNFLKPEHNANS